MGSIIWDQDRKIWKKVLAPVLTESTCLMQNRTDTCRWLIQDKLCLEVLSDENKLEMNSGSLHVEGELWVFVFLRVGNAVLDDGGHRLSAGWKGKDSPVGDSSWLVHKSAWRSYRNESAKIYVVAK